MVVGERSVAGFGFCLVDLIEPPSHFLSKTTEDHNDIVLYVPAPHKMHI